MNHMRAGMPQGESMAKALAATEVTWTSGRSGAGDRRARSPDMMPVKEEHPRSYTSGAGGKGGAQPSGKKMRFAQHTKGGKRYCPDWNLGKCTKGKCPMNGLHQCNAILPNNQVCQATDHKGCEQGIRH